MSVSGLDNTKVSFIVAAYNVDPFIKQAVDSALDQRGLEVEVIVVNDCSSDRTAEIVAEMAKFDSRIVLINNASQQGPSRSRNIAVSHASGDWLAILDGDDFIEPQRCMRLVKLATEFGADLIADDINRIFLQETVNRHSRLQDQPREEFTYLINPQMYIDHNCLYTSRKNLGYLKPMFRAQFLRDNAIRYDEAVRIGEDFLICLACLLRSARFVVSSEKMYNYRVRTGSLSWRLSAADIGQLKDSFLKVVDASGRPESSGEVMRARDEYIKSLDTAMLYTLIIENLKKGRVAAAAAMALGHPDVYPIMLDLFYVRLARSFRKVWKS